MKKGFTLVELSIVLVIIGILMGMVVKGRSMIHSARVQKEMVKIYKFKVSLNVYMTQFDGYLPIANNSSDAAVVVIEPIIQAGLLLPEDLNPEYLAPDHVWVFSRMTINKGPALKNSYLHSVKGIYIAAQPVNKANKWGNKVPGRLVCYIEHIIDDRNTFSGEGRHITGPGGLRQSYDPYINDYGRCNEATAIFDSYAYNLFQ